MSAKSPNPTDKHVGNRVRMRRMMAKMSQTTLGNAMSISFQQLQKYENGTNRLSAGRLHQLSHILQVSVSFFFEGLLLASEASSEEGADIDDFLATSDGLSLTKYFLRIKNSNLRRRIVDLVEQIAARHN
jgi:transcriptional regulator with XRE-family HTH domain